LATELVKSKVNVVFYGNENTRAIIEKTGAEYRAYSHPLFEILDKTTAHIKNSYFRFGFLNTSLNSSFKITPNLLKDVERERPDLIIYDKIFFPAKYLIDILERRKEKSGYKPQTVMFITCFADNKKIEEKKDKVVSRDIWMKILMFYLLIKQMIFNFINGCGISHPQYLHSTDDDNLNIVSVVPELQPMRETFDDARFKFVGSCVVEKVRNFQVNDAKMKEILDNFKPGDLNQKIKLVYFSLGTTFNEIESVIETVFEAFRNFDRKSDRKVKFQELKIVVSLGNKMYAKFARSKLPGNVHLFSKVPQLEVLKRSSLFITHGGMNSASEAIQYSVPLVCLPIAADQPLVAERLCEDLKLGIRFDISNLNINEINNAIEEVLTNETYRANVVELSRVSQRYNGSATAAQLILDRLNQIAKKKN
jgi:MGT family glycosyltransferase